MINRNLKSFYYGIVVFGITNLLYVSLRYGKTSEFNVILFLLFCVLIVVSLVQIIQLLIIIYNRKTKIPKIIIGINLILFCTIPITEYFRRKDFSGEKKLEAAFIDDRSRMDLTLFKNGKYLIKSNWLFGMEEFKGDYILNKDTIEFKKYPLVENDLLAKKIIMKKDKIFFRRNKNGEYDTTFYYFQIDFDKKR